MKSRFITLFIAHLVVLAATLCDALNPFKRGHLRLSNTITIDQEMVETHCDSITSKTDDSITARDLLFGLGSDANHVQINGAAELPFATVDNKTLVAEDAVAALLLAGTKTRRMVASEAISAGELVYTAANGKVQDEPGAAGTYYLVGLALTAALADGDTLEVLPFPLGIKTVVIAALTSTDGVAAAAADLAALKAEAEKIGDDVRAIGAALAAPALLKVLAA